jgi:hypothetical protein
MEQLYQITEQIMFDFGFKTFEFAYEEDCNEFPIVVTRIGIGS